MAGWDELVARRDAAVDEKLGNDVLYAKTPGNFRPIKAFVMRPGEGDFSNFNVVDPLNNQDRLKVNKKIIEMPSKSHVIRHPNYPADMRPENWITTNDGLYWLIDLQKA